MKLWEKLSGIIFSLLALSYLKTFKENRPEIVLRRSLKVMSPDTVNSLKEYVKTTHTQAGGFADKAGKADIYYTLFGYFVADALELNEITQSVKNFVQSELKNKNLKGVNLHSATILLVLLGGEQPDLKLMQKKIRESMLSDQDKQPGYNTFLNLLTCYYLKDYKSLFLLSRKLKITENQNTVPCSVNSAQLVLQRSFNKPAGKLVRNVLSFYNEKGGFCATRTIPLPDLLSTAVALYALNYAGYDLGKIKPECFEFVDSLYDEGGFGGNILDPDTDIEYTFYGLLALGALAG